MYIIGNDLSNEAIIRISDSVVIPKDESNIDYIAYLEWLSLGNTPSFYKDSIEFIKKELHSLIKERYLATQSMSIIGDANFSIPLTGEKYAYLQAIIDRAVCGVDSDIQEYQFEAENGDLYYIELSNFFWVKLFSELSKYSSANRRFKLAIEEALNTSNSIKELDNVRTNINLFPSPIILDINKLTKHLSSDTTIPSEFLQILINRKDTLFRKVSIVDTIKDIENMKEKYAI